MFPSERGPRASALPPADVTHRLGENDGIRRELGSRNGRIALYGLRQQPNVSLGQDDGSIVGRDMDADSVQERR